MLEIACFNLESAIIAANAGVDRIEFCADFQLGGTTPDLEDFKILKSKIHIPIYIMIRCRGGNFVYSEDEFSLMKKQMQELQEANADGFVFGFLNEKNEILVNKCLEFISVANGNPCTFHRAFDRTENIEKSLEILMDCGFTTVLTSGGKPNVSEGKEGLKNLITQSNNRIDILCGGGLRSTNISEIEKKTGATNFHSSGILQGEIADFDEIQRLKTLIST